MPDSRDYTVGWICALVSENVASKAFLDEEYRKPEDLPPHDNNNYTLGRIGFHNVVIAVLAEGEYGTSSAASVARDMLHSFPNVRIGLLVGIGSGCPSRRNDIRLGDVVVSLPSNGTGGVIQYDYGKTIQNQEFQATGFLNQPPAMLRSAINGVRSNYEAEGHEIEEAIANVIKKKPRLKKKYSRPQYDRLYKSDFTHPIGSEDHRSVICNDTSELIPRQERDEDEDNPAIHYGLIASGNQLIGDAHFRDSLVEKGVMCIETEAAGLMNHFPCLIIRGICDYADSHKNDEWHGYASMTAAAFAKDLLNQIPTKRVQAERKIGELLSEGGFHEFVENLLLKHTVAKKVHDLRRDVADIAKDQNQANIDRWLSPPDPTLNYNLALDRRQDGTGVWITQSPAFTEWMKKRNPFPWPQGIPGCGKTILTTTVIEALKKIEVPCLLYFYF